jgi:hypothetical protein
VRQLNIYGFKKIKASNCTNCFKNPNFKRNRKNNLRKIKRNIDKKPPNENKVNIRGMKESVQTMEETIKKLDEKNIEYQEIISKCRGSRYFVKLINIVMIQ